MLENMLFYMSAYTDILTSIYEYCRHNENSFMLVEYYPYSLILIYFIMSALFITSYSMLLKDSTEKRTN